MKYIISVRILLECIIKFTLCITLRVNIRNIKKLLKYLTICKLSSCLAVCLKNYSESSNCYEHCRNVHRLFHLEEYCLTVMRHCSNTNAHLCN